MRKLYKAFGLAVLLISLIACKENSPKVIIETEIGDITIELYDKAAPLTAHNFLAYVDKAMFNNGEFYRVVTMHNQPQNEIKIEVIQGGLGWDDNIPRLDSIAHESTQKTGIKHLNGTISMARNQPGSASSEFFICIGPQPELDYGGMRNPDGEGFAAFGKVIDGMDIALKIHQSNNENQFLKPSIRIISIKRR